MLFYKATFYCFLNKDLKDEELTNLSRQSYKYSNQNFSLESFTDRFSEIIDDIEANYSK